MICPVSKRSMFLMTKYQKSQKKASLPNWPLFRTEITIIAKMALTYQNSLDHDHNGRNQNNRYHYCRYQELSKWLIPKMVKMAVMKSMVTQNDT